MKRGEFGLHAIDDDVMIEAELRGPAQGYSGKYVDDMSKQVLKDSLVQEARATELLHFNSKGVWRKRPRSDASQKTGRSPITVRRVDVNKGDDIHTNYRSRLVAMQLKATYTPGKSYFAPAPPLEALRSDQPDRRQACVF